MRRQYETLVNLCLELGIGEGSAPPQQEQRAELNARYADALQSFVSDLLEDHRSGDLAIRAVNDDLNEIASLSGDGMQPIVDKIRYDIVNSIETQVGPKFWQGAGFPRLVGLAGVVLVALLVGGYFGLRSYNAIPLGAPIETRAGIEQRANLLAKVLQYGAAGQTSVRPTGVIRSILRWPFEATEAELAAGGELADVIFYGAAELAKRHQACNVPVAAGQAISGQEIAMLEKIVAHLRDKKTIWREPPAMTILDTIKTSYPC
jgi:hypothetical protein